VSKVYFPRLVIPLAATGAPLVDFAVSTLVLIALMAWYGVPLSSSLVATPLLVALLVFASVGAGTLLSALTVAYRDFTHITPFLLQLWMYATPVVFPASLVPPKWQWVLNLNPMTGVIEGFRSAFLGRPFDIASLAVSAAIAVAVFAVGVAYFERVERGFADII
jgi:lipopolysaccharide transport system permease protein